MIRWISDSLGTAAYSAVQDRDDIHIIDVRELVDKGGNNGESVAAFVHAGLDSLRSGKKTVVCCDYGMSRSNAIAVGIVALSQKKDFVDALRLVQERTGENEIKLGVLKVVREALFGQPEAKKGTKSILLTGHTGFVGAKVHEALEQRGHTVVLTPEGLDLSLGATGLGLLAVEHGVDVVVHCANPRIANSTTSLGTSLAMLRNVCEVALTEDIPLLFPSCWTVFSGYTGEHHLDETAPLKPAGPYGEAKFLAETLINHLRESAGLQCFLLRSASLYAEGGMGQRFIHAFARKIAQGQDLVTHSYRSGPPSLDLMHVADFVSAVLLVLERGSVGDYHVGTNVLTSTREVAELINTFSNGSSRISSTEIDSDVASIALDSSRIGETLGWAPKIDLRHGLQRVINHKNEG